MTTKKKILIIDDDAGILDVLTIILADQGYDIETVEDDTNIFEIVDEFKPDLILLDVWMPGIGGKEICLKLKKNSINASIPILIVSASVGIEQVVKDCGADGYIAKPFDMDELITKVKEKIGDVSKSQV